MDKVVSSHIRAVKEEDLTDIARIRCAGFSNSDSFITRLGEQSTYRYLRWLLNDVQDLHFICAEVEGRIVGYGILAKKSVIKLKHYIQKDWPHLTLSVARKPHLLYSSSFKARKSVIDKLLKQPSVKKPRAVQSKRAICSLIDTAVDPDFQGLGIGTSLLFARENIAEEVGYDLIRCSIKKVNTVSINLHEKYGYAIFEESGDEVRMEKALRPSPKKLTQV